MITPPLKYFPVEIGKAKLHDKNNHLSLSHENRYWMGLNKDNLWQADEFTIELSLAKGICVTTGLGLGIIQTILCQNDNVNKVIVYEKNQDIIDIFLTIVEKNNFDISKLEIKQKNADELVGENCHCMFLDHFEGEPEVEILDRVRNIEKNNTTEILWYWPAAHHFIIFLEKKRKSISHETYVEWKNYTGLKFLPNSNSYDIIENLKFIREIYLKNATGGLQQSVKEFEIRNKMLEKFRNRRVDK